MRHILMKAVLCKMLTSAFRPVVLCRSLPLPFPRWTMKNHSCLHKPAWVFFKYLNAFLVQRTQHRQGAPCPRAPLLEVASEHRSRRTDRERCDSGQTLRSSGLLSPGSASPISTVPGKGAVTEQLPFSFQNNENMNMRETARHGDQGLPLKAPGLPDWE